MPIFVPSSAGSSPVGIIEPSQRIIEPTLSTAFTTGTFSSLGAGCVAYVGQVITATAFAFVQVWVTSAATGTQVCEVGIFSSPLPPTASPSSPSGVVGTGQTLTCLAASALTDSFLSTGLKQSLTSMSGTTVPAGTYLWVGIRHTAMSTNPTFSARSPLDSNSGVHAFIPTGVTLAAASTYVIASIQGNVPNMRLTLD